MIRLFAAATLLTWAPASAAENEANLVLAEVSGAGFIFSDGLFVDVSTTNTRIALSELAGALELAVDVSESGIIGPRAPGRPAFNLTTTSLLRDGMKRPLKLGEAVVINGQIFVSLELAEDLLAVDLKFNSEALQIVVTPRSPLPAQLRAERSKRRVVLDSDGQPLGENISADYTLVSMPSLDIVLNGDLGNSNSTRTSYDLRAAGDLAFMGYQAFLGSDQRGIPSNARLTLERIDPNAGIAGLTRVAFGDVFSPALGLGPRSTSGRGIFLTNTPLQQTSVFDRIDLRGELPAGFDVELYVNDVLRGQQRGRTDGRYEFLSIPLQRGINLARLVFYGPRGERREEIRSINVGAGQVPAGTVQLFAGVVEQERPLITLRQRGVVSQLGTTPQSAIRGAIGLSWGISEASTVTAGAALYQPDVPGTSPRGSGIIGFRGSIMGLSSQADFAADDKGGSALALGLAGRLGRTSAVLRHTEYRGGFVDEVAVFLNRQAAASRATDLRVDSAFSVASRQIPLSAAANWSQYVDGSQQFTGSLRSAVTLGKGFVSGGVEYQGSIQRPATPDQNRVQAVAEVDMGVVGGWSMRASAASDLTGGTNRLIGVVFDRRGDDRRSLRLGVTQSLGNVKDTLFQASRTWLVGKALMSLGASYQTRGSVFRLNLNFATGLIFDPFRRRYRSTLPGATATGALAVKVVAPSNDGEMQPVEGLVIEGGQRRTVSDVDGEILVFGLGPPRARLRVSGDELPDPWLVVPSPTFDVRARPGKVTRHEVALEITAQTRLIAYLVDEQGRRTAVSAVRLAVQAPDGTRRTIVTQYDGSAFVDDLSPGRWTIVLEAAQAKRLGIRLKSPIVIEVPTTGGSLPPLTLLIERLS